MVLVGVIEKPGSTSPEPHGKGLVGTLGSGGVRCFWGLVLRGQRLHKDGGGGVRPGRSSRSFSPTCEHCFPQCLSGLSGPCSKYVCRRMPWAKVGIAVGHGSWGVLGEDRANVPDLGRFLGRVVSTGVVNPS